MKKSKYLKRKLLEEESKVNCSLQGPPDIFSLLEKMSVLMCLLLLLKKDQGWEAVSYAWNKEQNEAFKKIAGKTINVSWTDFMGEERDVRYRVPNVNQCKECHDADDKISPIGPKARNINKDFAFKEGTFNQLTYWMNRQIIDEYPLDLVSPVDWTDESKDINDLSLIHI